MKEKTIYGSLSTKENNEVILLSTSLNALTNETIKFNNLSEIEELSLINGNTIFPQKVLFPGFEDINLQKPVFSEFFNSDKGQIIIIANNKDDLISCKLEYISDLFDELYPEAEYIESENGDSYLSGKWQDKFNEFSDSIENSFTPAHNIIINQSPKNEYGF